MSRLSGTMRMLRAVSELIGMRRLRAASKLAMMSVPGTATSTAGRMAQTWQLSTVLSWLRV